MLYSKLDDYIIVKRLLKPSMVFNSQVTQFIEFDVEEIEGYKPILSIYGGSNNTSHVIPYLVSTTMYESGKFGIGVRNTSTITQTTDLIIYVLYIRQ